MFDLIPVKTQAELQTALASRLRSSAFFCRIYGYDDPKAFTSLMQRLYEQALKNGCYIQSPIPNPAEKEVADFLEQVKSPYIYDHEHVVYDIRRWLAGIDLKNAEALSEAILEQMAELRRIGSRDSILKNAYIKFLCWLKGRFSKAAYGVGEYPLPTIVMDGQTGKYELYLLQILAQAGSDVFCVNCFPEKMPPIPGLFSRIEGKIHELFVFNDKHADPIINPPRANGIGQLENQLATIDCEVEINTWLREHWLNALEQSNAKRGGSSRKICNLLIRYVGVDEDRGIYMNRLYGLKCHLKQWGKPYVLLENSIPSVSVAEVESLTRVNYSDSKEMAVLLAKQINFCNKGIRDLLLQKEFLALVQRNDKGNLSQLYNYSAQMLCWLKRYGKKLLIQNDWEKVPILIYYGNCLPKERDFLYLLARAGVDVVVIMPNKEADKVFANTLAGQASKLDELPSSSEVVDFPNREVKIRVATTAYHAERDLDTILYTGTGLFRDRQFTCSKPITLKATYEEILLLWKEEAKYRPYFQAHDHTVVVPNIFAKICGVKDGDLEQYFNTIGDLITEDTIVVKNIPFLPDSMGERLMPYVGGLMQKGRILPDVIQKHPQYHYEYLNENTQQYMLEKMQELLDLNWLQYEQKDLDKIVLATLLDLSLIHI